MTDRRETPRAKPHKSNKRRSRGLAAEADWSEGERIAKYLARAGIASRREIEAKIENREIRVDGLVLTTPAFKVTGREDIRVNGIPVKAPEASEETSWAPRLCSYFDNISKVHAKHGPDFAWCYMQV